VTGPYYVVVVGGGVAGLEVASKRPRSAGRIAIAVMLVDREAVLARRPYRLSQGALTARRW
jgi:NADH dehydrogenase